LTRRGFVFAAASIAGLPAARAETAEAALWEAMRRGGVHVLMRHAHAPGTGDQAGFKLSECRTQRNLDARGKDEARAIGRAFKRERVRVGAVHASQWCRAMETARLLDLGVESPLPALNSFYDDRARAPYFVARLKSIVSRRFAGPAIVYVTHQVNITGLTGIVPQTGEMVVIRPEGDGRFAVLGRLVVRP
jgi:phosphohistidine phosphatase SixA